MSELGDFAERVGLSEDWRDVVQRSLITDGKREGIFISRNEKMDQIHIWFRDERVLTLEIQDGALEIGYLGGGNSYITGAI